jgi:hypothetical protein
MLKDDNFSQKVYREFVKDIDMIKKPDMYVHDTNFNVIYNQQLWSL